MPDYRNVWFVVADGTRARIISHRRKDFRLLPARHAQILSEEVWPAAGLLDRGLVTDKPGRGFQSVGAHRHAYREAGAYQEEEKKRFAKSLAERVNAARLQGLVDEIVLIMPPAMLGAVRASLDPQTMGLVVRALSKDVSQMKEAEILETLPEWYQA